MTRLELGRQQILAFRRRVGLLHGRHDFDQRSIRLAAWAGLQDSVPRAALLSIHARVEKTESNTWEDSSLVQLWGPRFNAYVVPARDRAVFTLGRLPHDAARRQVAEDLAARLNGLLDGATMTYAAAGRALGEHPNRLRYAAPTGTILMRWDGARQPAIWTVPAPDVDPHDARLELVRRYLHVFGPATPEAFAWWAGIPLREGTAMFESLRNSLTVVQTPADDAWILTRDEEAFRAAPEQEVPARLLPSGDAYFLLQGDDRALLISASDRRRALWPSRVWPGAVLVRGEIVGTWRRKQHTVTVEGWRSLFRADREAVEAEAASLPLPGLAEQVVVHWND